MLDRDYNLLGKAPQEKIGTWSPEPYAITADSIYFRLNGKITHYIDTSNLSNLELLPMPDTSSARPEYRKLPPSVTTMGCTPQ